MSCRVLRVQRGEEEEAEAREEFELELREAVDEDAYRHLDDGNTRRGRHHKTDFSFTPWGINVLSWTLGSTSFKDTWEWSCAVITPTASFGAAMPLRGVSNSTTL